MLDEAGFADAKIVVSNSLDEYTIRSILDQGGRIDAFGVGGGEPERMVSGPTVSNGCPIVLAGDARTGASIVASAIAFYAFREAAA